MKNRGIILSLGFLMLGVGIYLKFGEQDKLQERIRSKKAATKSISTKKSFANVATISKLKRVPLSTSDIRSLPNNKHLLLKKHKGYYVPPKLNQKNQKGETREKSFLAKYFPKSQKRLIGGKEYFVSDTLRVTNKRIYKKEMGTKLKEIGRIVIYSPQVATTSKSTNKVLYNPKNQQLSIASGKIILSLSSNARIQEVLKDFNLNLKFSAEHINTYVVNPKDPAKNIFQVQEELLNSQLISSAKAEVVDALPGVR